MQHSYFLDGAHAQTYVLDKTISLPGNAGYDYLSIDKVNHRLFVSHGTTVNVIDLETEQPAGVIADMKGVHGIAIVNKSNKGFISDGRANAVVAFDLTTLKTIAVIPIDAKGPDAIIYDPFSDRVFSFNGESSNSSVIDPKLPLNKWEQLTWAATPNLQWLTGKEKFTIILKIKAA